MGRFTLITIMNRFFISFLLLLNLPLMAQPNYTQLALDVIQDGNTVAWYDSKDLSTITKDCCSLVERWNDKLLSGHDLIQSSIASRPKWGSSGVLFDGIDDFMKTASFTLIQPTTCYLVFNQKTSNNNDYILDGFTDDSGPLFQNHFSTLNDIRLRAGSLLAPNSELPLNTVGVVKVIINGANSKVQVNNTESVIGDAGSLNMNGITLAKYGSTNAVYGNIEFQELIFRNVVDNANDELLIYNYLTDKYNGPNLRIFPTGNGTGVATLTLKLIYDETITLDDGAKFYTDALGTIGESSSAVFLAGVEKTVYIKSTYGNARLGLDERNVVKWEWNSFANAPLISGNIETFYDLEYIDIQGNNTLSGNVSGLVNLVFFEVRGQNTLSGSISNMVNLKRVVNLGSNPWPDRGSCRLTGDITNLSQLEYLRVFGSNTISGDITNLNNLLYIQMDGNAVISGDITNLVQIQMLDIVSSNVNSQITGSVTNLVNMYYLWLDGGADNVTGDVTGLVNLRNIWMETPNTLTGTLSSNTYILLVNIQGSNTVSVDLGVYSNVIGADIVLSPCGVTNYTSGGTWNNINVEINPSVGYGLSASEIDNMLIDMAASIALVGKTIKLQGSNSPRTSLSDTAVSTLLSRGCTVITN